MEKVIILDKFYAGIAGVDLDKDSNPGECGYAQEMNLINNEGFLTPGLEMTADETGLGTVGMRFEGFATGPGTGSSRHDPFMWGVAYYDAAGTKKQQAMVKSSPTGDWSATGTPGAGQAAEIAESVIRPWLVRHNDGSLYWPSRITGAFNITQGSTDDQAWDNLAVAAWGNSPTNFFKYGGAIVHNDGNLYFWGDRYIGPYDGTTKPSLVTPFGIQTDYVIMDAISIRNKILIAGNHRTNSFPSKLFLLEPYAPGLLYTFDDVYETNLYNIQALKLVEGQVKVITGNGDYVISDWAGADYVIPSRVIPVGVTSTLNVNRQAVDVKRNTMYFGTNAGNITFNAGIYTYGRSTDQDPWCISNEHINDGADITNVEYRSIKWWHYQGNETLFANWYDGTNYNISRLTTTKADGVYETVWFRPYPGLKSQIRKMTIYCEAMPASCQIVVSEKVDGGNYTTIATIDTDNAIKAVITPNRMIVSTTSADTVSTPTAAWAKGYKHKIKVAFTSSTTNAVEIEKIKIRVATEEDE